MREHLVEKYFTPLEPDSARIPYEIRPSAYADPYTEPKPVSMEVEIRDCDSIVVYTGELSNTVQEHQVYWWDGKDNTGRYTDPEKSPYLATITLTYRETKGGRQFGFINRSTRTINAPEIIDVPILTRINLFESPTNKIRYLDAPGPLRFSTVVLGKISDTGAPLADYICYHPEPFPGQTALIYNPDWPYPHEFLFNVEKWQVPLWGWLSHIRWCEVRPKIIDDDADKVGYADSTVLGNWIYNAGFGWGWDENVKEMTEGTLRYRVHIENWKWLFKLQEATTPRGIGLFRVSVKGNFFNGVINWAFSYLGVPFVIRTSPKPNGRNIHGQLCGKWIHKGYEGIDCSGLTIWSFIRDGEPLSELNPDCPQYEDSVACYTDCARLHGYKNQVQYVVIEDTVNSDNDVNWDGWDDADSDKNGVIEGNEWPKLQRKLDLAQDGDMWFIDHSSDGLGEAQCPDHVGIYFTKIVASEVVGRLIEANASVRYNKVRTTDEDDIPDPKNSRYWNGKYEESIFRGLRRRSQ